MILAGHQPQLFHPGVWFKNFVLSRLAESQAATAVNLVIDSDTIKTAAVRVPTGSASRRFVESIPLDRDGGRNSLRRAPDPRSRSVALSFGERAGGPSEPGSRIRCWRVLAAGRGPGRGGAQAWASACRRPGTCRKAASASASLELPQSRVCSLPAFHWFTAICSRTCRGCARSLQRRRGRVSPGQPHRSLVASGARSGRDGEWLEAPYLDVDARQSDPPATVRPSARGANWCCRPQGDQRSALASAEADASLAAEQLAGLPAVGHQDPHPGPGDHAVCPADPGRSVPARHRRSQVRSGDRSADRPVFRP